MDESNQDYDSYEQYSNNDDVYETIKINIWDELVSFPEDILTEPTENKDDIAKDCAKLSKYLKNFYNREKCKTQNCCQYINYTLNKSVRKYYNSEESIFGIYKKYMNHKNNNMINNLCLTEINYMTEEKYNKIDQLYSAYNMCKYYIPINKDRINCYYAKFCYKAYNDITTQYIKQDDIKFCKTLKELKDFLEGYKPHQTINCDLKNLDLLYYPDVCTELLHKSEEINESMKPPNVGPEVHGTLRKLSEEQRQEKPEEGSPGVLEHVVRESAVGEPGGRTNGEEKITLFHTQSDVNDVSTDSPSAKTSNPVGTIIGTSLGFVLPLITIYRVRRTYL
ncbi:hypothetical protein PVIIG_06196 [Plasmodium vivax India VII]|uniref:Uncharacterized protein n=1 Tax=Plasmodium vivax India VII TaxID=1077284 RepID=A0A0J9SKF8_PLAVI|nr:hypothetical protein PVIIG_06196 [Plasmodium vivax India VII]